MGFSRYQYAVEVVTWPEGSEHLPDTIIVDLPSYLVESDANDEEWDEYIFEDIIKKVGVQPVEIGSVGPADDF